MKLAKCPECGNMLTKEMLDVNMCWECGKILDESLLDEKSLSEITKQAEEQNPFCNPDVKKHKLTTGYNFEGYRIVEYVGLVSGEAVLGTGFFKDYKASFSDLFGTESKSYSNTIKEAKRAVLYDMIKESINCGGDAIIGISYEFMVFSGNMVGVSVNGTSVVIEKQ